MFFRMRRSLPAEIRSALAAHGYAYLPAFSPDPSPASLLALARALGPIYLPAGVDLNSPYLETHPTADASYLEPFDLPRGIGWHNDFATHLERPAVSLAFLAQADPAGPARGAWRVASCGLVLDYLLGTTEGSSTVRFLRDNDVPFSFTGEGPPAFFRVLEQRGLSSGRRGLRFYGRAIRDGARLAFGEVPDEVEHAIDALERAADAVGRVIEAPAGALLVTDNWQALHDRLPQSVGPGQLLRRSLLCFVERLEEEHD